MADKPIRVKAYGKILNFPAGTTPEAIESALAEHEPTLNPEYKPPLSKQIGDGISDFAKNSLGIDIGGLAKHISEPQKSIGDLAEESAIEGENTAATQVRGAPVRQSTYNTALVDPAFGVPVRDSLIQRKPNHGGILGRIRNTADTDARGQEFQQGLKGAATDRAPSPEGGFIASAKTMTGQTIKGVGRVASDFLDYDKDNAISAYGQKLIDENPLLVKNLGDIKDEPFMAFKEATGNMAPSLGGMLGAKALGMGITSFAPLTGPAAPIVAAVGTAVQWLGPVAVGALPSYSGIRDKQILNNPKNEQDAKAKAIAALGAGAVGVIEQAFGPQQWALAALTKEGRSALARKFAATSAPQAILKGAIKGAAIEGSEELAQNPIEQLASFDNPTTRESLKETAFGGAMGAIGGFAPGGVIAGTSFVADRRTQVLSEKRKIAELKARMVSARQQEQDMAGIGAARDIDQVITAANKAAKSSVTANDILRTEDPTLADIERLTGLRPTEAIDTAINEINNPRPEEELENVNTQTQQTTTTQTPVLAPDVEVTTGITPVEGADMGTTTTTTTTTEIEAPVPKIKDEGTKIRPLAENSLVANAETFKASGDKRTYDQYLREHPNRKQAAAIDSRIVEDNLVKGLQKTGKFNVMDSKTYAKPFSEFYRVNAERQGILPSELYERMPLNFSGKNKESPQVQLKQGEKVPTVKVNGTERPAIDSDNRIISNPEKFHQWFGDSKVTDKEGRPLTVYHGTGQDFSEFSADKGGGARYRTGVFFSDSPDVASTYASGDNKNVVKSYVSLRNPVVVDVKGSNWNRLGPSVSVELPEAVVADTDEDLLAQLEDRFPNKNASRKLKARKTSLKGLFPDDMGYSDDTMSTNDLVRWAREQGYEGVVIKNVIDTGPSGAFHTEKSGEPHNSFVVFDPKQIKSAVGNNGDFNPADPNILKQSKKVTHDRSLIAQHNISVKGLLHADRMGGLAAPSLAITDKDEPLTGFGEITLLSGSHLVDPKRGAKVFGADIYSPRYPSVTLGFDRKSVERLNSKLKPFADTLNSDPIGFYELNNAGSSREVTRTLKQEPAVLAAFLTEKGINPKYKERPKAIIAKELKPFAGATDAQTLVANPNFIKAVERLHKEFLDVRNSGDFTQSDKDRFLRNLAYDDAHRVVSYSKYLEGRGKVDPTISYASMRMQIDNKKLSDELEVYIDGLIQGIHPEEKIFKGFTYSGNRKYSAHTLENIVNELKKNLRGGETFNYGLGTVRSKYTPQFKSLDQIRKEKGRLVSNEEFDSIKNEVGVKFDELGTKLDQYHEAARFDTFAQMAYDSATMGIPKAMRENGYRDVPAETQGEVRDFLADLAHLPTEYFEVKLPRAVDLSEFSAAVVPKHTPQSVVGILKKNGITDIRKYKDAEDRKKQIGSFDDLLFQSNFYSALEEEIGNLKKIANKDGLVSVEQAKAWINSRQKEGKFKQAEVEAVGLMDWLDTLGGKVPVSDVEQFVADNGVQVEEVILEGDGAPDIDEDRVYDLARQDFSDNYEPSYDIELFDDAIGDVADKMLDNHDDGRWGDLVGLNDVDEVEAWLKSEEMGDSRRYMVRVLKDRYQPEEILGDDKYYEIHDEQEQYDWELSQDYYMTQARERLENETGGSSGGTEFGNYVLRGGSTEYKELLLTLPNNKARFNAPHFYNAQDSGLAENVFAHTRINERYLDLPLTAEQEAEKIAYDEWVKGNNTPEIIELVDAKREAAQAYDEAVDAYREKIENDKTLSNVERIGLLGKMYNGDNPPAELKPFIEKFDEIGAKVKAKQEERLAIKPKEPTKSNEKERVLFVEEIQSGWAQKGRDNGFKGAGLTEEQKERKRELGTFLNTASVDAEGSEAIHKAQVELGELKELEGINKVPTAPFVTDTKAWTGLVVRRLLRYAAENGFDRIAWTNGAQQSERYRLSKFVERVKATRSGTLENSYLIKAEDANGKTVVAEYYEADKLAGVIGKELTEKIISQPDGEQIYRGLDLNVGGHGMKEFYDRIVPSVVNDVSRKLGGGKVENVSMGSQSGRVVIGLDGKILITYPNGSYLKNRNTGAMTESQDRADKFASKEEAGEYLNKFEAQNLHEVGRQMSLAVTPALKEKVMQGLPLFQRDRAGYNPNTFTISLMDGSDMSSVIHEGGHFYLEALAEMASRSDAPAQVVEDFDTTLAWFGIGGDTPSGGSVKRNQGYPSVAGEPISTFNSAEDIKSHQDYSEAKAGGDQAAYDLVNDLVTESNLNEAKQRFSGATFVPVSLLDKDGANRIPTALAYHYANAVGGSVSDQIFETKKAYHTGMNAMERLISRAGFSGRVEPGRKYVLVDDVTTIGSTLADLASYIQEKGGEVVGSVLLANATRSGKMFANVKILKRLEAQYGNEIRELFNIEPNALTQEEAQYLIGFRNADELRNSAINAQGSRLSRIHARQVPESGSSVAAQKRRDLWHSMPLEQKRPYHEQWAQSFERYAMEGISPTEGMQPIFERFKQWMLETYKSLKEFLKNNPLAGRLNNEVRQVFDRLIASEADIKKTAEARGTLKQSGRRKSEPGQTAPKKSFDPDIDIPETRFRKAQRLTQDSFNRFTVMKDWLKEKGVTLSEKADVSQAEERYHSLVANQLEDFREQVRNPLIEKISKAGFTLSDVSDFLEAQHAEEANVANRKLTGLTDSEAFGISDADAAAYLSKAPKNLAVLANELRDITEQSKKMRLKAGLLSQDQVDAMDATYKFYIPVKGDADTKGGAGKGLKVNFRSKRRLGHGRRDEAVIENIFLDHERAIMQVEKNRVAKHLVMMAAEMNMPEIVSIGQPVKRNVLRSKTAYEVQVNGATRSVFSSKQAADMFKQLLPTIDKSVQAGTVTINPTSDQRVIAMASPMLAENEINAYIDGHAIRVQINDDLLARAYSKLGITGFSALVSAGRAFNGYLSKAYTGYNPEFILTNIRRDFLSGLINLTGEEGIKISALAVKNYFKSFGSLMRYAISNGVKSDKWIDMYRANGGNTGAAYLSDLERLGDEVKTEFASYQGVAVNLKSGDITNASRAAGRKAFNATLKWVYNLNQASENAMRLAAFRAMIESGKTKNEAAKVAKNITVNFNRKGELGAEANAAYLFFNASVQGAAALAHAHFKGKHKFQAWGLSASLVGLGYAATMALLGGDDDEYDKIDDYTKSRNLLIKAGDGYAKVPVPYGYGFFWNLGRAFAEAKHTGEWGRLPWQVASSFIEEFTPFSDTVVGSQDGFQFDQVLLGVLPTVIKIPAQPAFNRQLFSGGEMFPERASQQFQPDREKMWRSTQGTVYDKMAGLLEEGLGQDVSPETLKHYTRTFTGGAGAFVDSGVSAIMLKKEGAELEPSEIPFVRKEYMKITIKEQRAAYYKAREEAKKTAEAFNRAKTRNDVTTIDKLVKDEGEMIGLDAYANSLSEVIGATRDLQDSIRLDEKLTAAEKRAQIKELEITEGKFYDQYLDVFKVEKLKMKERKN